MGSIRLRTPGKINWTLEVIGRRRDSYHDVRMLMQSVSLFDQITLSDRASGITVVSDSKDIPLGEGNIAYRAADLIKRYSKRESGVEIAIEKQIPMAAGMAGGSTDAAAVLVGLNELWSLGLPYSELEAMGKDIGADVPFCIQGGTALAEGIGEKLTHLDPIGGIWLLLVKPPFDLSTADVYGGLDMDKLVKDIDVQTVYEDLKRADFSDKGGLVLGNDLEQVSIGLFPEIGRIKDLILQGGASASMMTGSGPSVYGVFGQYEKAREAKKHIEKHYSQVYLINTWDRGPEIISKGGGNI